MTDTNYSAVVDIFTLDNSPVCDMSAVEILSSPRGYLTASATNMSVYFIGGWNTTNQRSTVVDRYVASTKTWETMQMHVPRVGQASVTLGNTVYIGGGTIDDSGAAVNFVTTIVEDATGKASFGVPMKLSSNRTNLAGTSISSAGQSLVLFAGGEGPSCGCEIGWMCTPDFSFCANVMMDILNFTDPASFSQTAIFLGSFDARSQLAGVTVGHVAYFAGGKNLTGWSSTVDIYDATTGTWQLTYLSVPRGNLAASVDTSGKIYFAGGENDNGVSNVVDIYDTMTGMWLS